MRIVLVGPVYPYRGGIAHYTTMLQRALEGRGHSTQVVSFKRQYPRWLFPGESDRDPSHQALRAQAVDFAIDPLNPVTWLTASRRIRAVGPDVIVFPWWTTYWAPVWYVMTCQLRGRFQVPLVFICHNVLPHEASTRDRWLTRLALHHGTHFIVQSDDESRTLLQLLPESRTKVVPHPVYDMLAGSVVTRAEARAKLGLAADAKLVLFFGLVREYKGLADLVDAIPQVAREIDSVFLLVAGEFWEAREGYLQRINELGIQSRIRIDDHYIPNEEVPLYFGAADVVVAPHRRATGSGVVQMAIGFGTPLVTTLGSQFEGMQLPRCIRTVPPSDGAALARGIVDLLNESDLASCAPDIKCLRETFSWDRLVRALELICTEAAEG